MLTDQELDIIRERLKQATGDGCWTYHEQEYADGFGAYVYVYTNGTPGTRRVIVHTPTPAIPEPPSLSRWQGAFIANAPTDIEMLLKHIAELESILRDMQDDSLAYREGVKAGIEEERRKGEAASRPHVPDWSPGRDYE